MTQPEIATARLAHEHGHWTVTLVLPNGAGIDLRRTDDPEGATTAVLRRMGWRTTTRWTEARPGEFYATAVRL